MVGRLVEQQQVRLLQQQLAQCHPTTLTAGEHRHVGVGRRQQGVHRLLELGVQIPGVAMVQLLLQLTLGEQLLVIEGSGSAS